MSDRIVAGFCDDNCKFEVYTREEIIGLLEYVIANNALPSDLIVDGNIDSSTNLAAVNAIVEQNKGTALKIWVGTQAEFDAYTGDKTNLYAIISDDQTLQNLLNKLVTVENNIASFEKTINSICDGITAVPKAAEATKSASSTYAIGSQFAESIRMINPIPEVDAYTPNKPTNINLTVSGNYLTATLSGSNLNSNKFIVNANLEFSVDGSLDSIYNLGLVTIPVTNESKGTISSSSIEVMDTSGNTTLCHIQVFRDVDNSITFSIYGETAWSTTTTYTLVMYTMVV